MTEPSNGSITTGELRHILAERDRFYLARIDALEMRMIDFKAAAERALDLAKISNDRAGEQLADALVAYKNSANEWQSTFREFRSGTLSRTETFAELGILRTLIDKAAERVNEIVRQRSQDTGVDDATMRRRSLDNARIGWTITLAAIGLTALIFLLNFFLK